MTAVIIVILIIVIIIAALHDAKVKDILENNRQDLLVKTKAGVKRSVRILAVTGVIKVLFWALSVRINDLSLGGMLFWGLISLINSVLFYIGLFGAIRNEKFYMKYNKMTDDEFAQFQETTKVKAEKDFQTAKTMKRGFGLGRVLSKLFFGY